MIHIKRGTDKHGLTQTIHATNADITIHKGVVTKDEDGNEVDVDECVVFVQIVSGEERKVFKLQACGYEVDDLDISEVVGELSDLAVEIKPKRVPSAEEKDIAQSITKNLWAQSAQRQIQNAKDFYERGFLGGQIE